jgi:hypothetical protein
MKQCICRGCYFYISPTSAHPANIYSLPQSFRLLASSKTFARTNGSMGYWSQTGRNIHDNHVRSVPLQILLQFAFQWHSRTVAHPERYAPFRLLWNEWVPHFPDRQQSIPPQEFILLPSSYSQGIVLTWRRKRFLSFRSEWWSFRRFLLRPLKVDQQHNQLLSLSSLKFDDLKFIYQYCPAVVAAVIDIWCSIYTILKLWWFTLVFYCLLITPTTGTAFQFHDHTILTLWWFTVPL